jgi:hypothetical protein
MKKIALTLAALAVAASSYAQGTLNFANRVSGVFSAQVTYAGDTLGAAGGGPAGPAGSGFWGQLYAAAPGGTLAAIGSPVEFRNDAGIGYITSGGVVSVAGVAGGSPAQVKLVAWHKSLGNDYTAAVAQGLGGWGESAVITVNTGGGGTPPAPAANLGVVGGTAANTLAGFEVRSLVPEPSMAALGLLGAGLLLIRRKK